MSIDASPPAQPPQMSPDGNWVWDGSQWQPVTGVEPTHEGVFAAYAQKIEAAEQAVVVAPPAAVASPVQVAAPAMQYPYPAPAPAADYYPAADPGVPLWEQPKSSRKTVYLYVGGAVVLFLMVLIVLNTINFLSLPFIGSRTSSNPPQAQASPTPNLSRSEASRADLFVTGSLGPALDSLTGTMAAVNSCNGTMSNSCFNAITASDPLLKNVISVIDHASIPPCIALTTANVRSDLVIMEAGLQLALKGYKENVLSEVVDGAYRFTHYGQAMVANGHAVESAAKTYCSTDLEGP